jgi:hypothetical protein
MRLENDRRKPFPDRVRQRILAGGVSEKSRARSKRTWGTASRMAETLPAGPPPQGGRASDGTPPESVGAPSRTGPTGSDRKSQGWRRSIHGLRAEAASPRVNSARSAPRFSGGPANPD